MISELGWEYLLERTEDRKTLRVWAASAESGGTWSCICTHVQGIRLRNALGMLDSPNSAGKQGPGLVLEL